MRQLLLSLLLLAGLASPVGATKYYVTSSGNGTHSGLTLANAMTLAEVNAVLTAGDEAQLVAGTLVGSINPARSGTAGAYIVYNGFPDDPSLCTITGDIVMDSTSATDTGCYIAVRGLTAQGQFTMGDAGYWSFRYDSLTSCVIAGSGQVTGGHNILTNCSFGQGDIGDRFTWTYREFGVANYKTNFLYAIGNQAIDCTFNLAITGSVNPSLQIRCQDSLLIDRCHFTLRIDNAGSSLHLWTIYGMTNSIIRDSYFDGQSLTAQESHCPSTRDEYHGNYFLRDTIVETPGGAAPINCALMTSGDTAIPNEYNGYNTYEDCYIRVGGPVYYQSTCNNDTHIGGTYISGSGPQVWLEADSVTIDHCTIVNLGAAVLGNTGGSMVGISVTNSLFYGATHITCNGQVSYGTTSPGTSDYNLVYVAGFPADSTEAFDFGGCASDPPGSTSDWCVSHGQDCHSHWADPGFAAYTNWTDIVPVPDSTSLAVSADYPDGYVGATDPRASSPPAPSLEITTATALPSATLGEAYSQFIGVTGGTQPYAWSLAYDGGFTFYGLSLNADTGEITDTPSNEYNIDFVVLVTDDVGDTTSRYFTLSAYDAEPTASNATTLGGFRVEANPYAASFYLDYSGDADKNLTGQAFIVNGAVRDSGVVADTCSIFNELCGSIFWLTPGRTYTAILVVTDPTGIVGAGMVDSVSATFTTPTIPPASGFNGIYYVDYVNGDDGGSGSLAQPFKTMQHAWSLLDDGTNSALPNTIYLMSGPHRDTLALDGTAGKDGGASRAARKYITGSSAAYLDGTDEAWMSVAYDSVTISSQKVYYKTGFTYWPRLVATDTYQLMRHPTLKSLVNDSLGTTVELRAGWFRSLTGDTMYVQLENGQSPNGLTMHYGRRTNLLYFKEADHITMTGVTVKYSGCDGNYNIGDGTYTGHGATSAIDKGAVMLYNCDDVRVTGCLFTLNGFDAIVIDSLNASTRQAHDCMVDNNNFTDVRSYLWGGLATFPQPIFGSNAHHPAICISSGFGHTIYGNTFFGHWDNIRMSNVNVGKVGDIDILNNTITWGEGGVEIDTGLGTNVRVVGNTISKCTDPFDQDMYFGPFYYVRNTVWLSIDPTFHVRSAFDTTYTWPTVHVYHNTFAPQKAGVATIGTNAGANILRGFDFANNLFVTATGRIVSAPDRWYDYPSNKFNYDMGVTGGTTFYELRAVTYAISDTATVRSARTIERNGRFATSFAFADSANGNFMPAAASSPAIDGGRRIPGINTNANQYTGAAPDIGAVEFATPTALTRRRGWLSRFIHIFLEEQK